MTIDANAHVRENAAVERGSVLVLALLVSLFLVGIGMTAMWLTSSGTNISGNITRRQEALTAAESGVERARAVLAASPNSWDTLLGTPGGGTCGATKDDPGGKGNVLCNGPVPLENFRLIGEGTQTANLTPAAERLAYTIYIRNDPEESAIGADAGVGGGPYDDEDRRVVIRSEGIGRDGLSYVAIETTLILGATGGVVVPDYAQAGQNSGGTNSGDTAIAE